MENREIANVLAGISDLMRILQDDPRGAFKTEAILALYSRSVTA